MNMNNIFLPSILVMSLAATGLGQDAMASDQPSAHTVTLKLEYISGVYLNGTPDPGADQACQTQFAKYLGLPVKTTWGGSATISHFQNPSSPTPKQITENLMNLGIGGVLEYATFRPKNFTQAYAVIFESNLDFTNPASTFVMFGPSGQDYNCIVSSTANPFQSAASAKFGMDAKKK